MATIAQVPASQMDLRAGQFSVTVDPTSLRQLNQIIKGLQNTNKEIDDPRTMAAGIPYIGQQWLYNWANRGNRVGGWAPVSAFTAREKERRGYGGARTLEQSGYFYKGAIAGFASWAPDQRTYDALIPATPAAPLSRHLSGVPSMSPDTESGPTGVGATIMRRTFNAAINGPKAEHQNGGAIRYGDGYANLPARPFWFFDLNMIDGAAEPMVNNFLGRWVEKMPNPVGAANRSVLGVFSIGQGRYV